MAGSRRDKLGSIFSRMTGLLRSGALKEEDRPIWYDIVKAFPPHPKPQRTASIQNILYPEDFVRVQFYSKFADSSVKLADNKVKSVSQRFVDQYLDLHEKKTVPADQMFDETVKLLKEQGVNLVTHSEKQTKSQARNKRKSSEVEKDPFLDKIMS